MSSHTRRQNRDGFYGRIDWGTDRIVRPDMIVTSMVLRRAKGCERSISGALVMSLRDPAKGVARAWNRVSIHPPMRFCL